VQHTQLSHYWGAAMKLYIPKNPIEWWKGGGQACRGSVRHMWPKNACLGGRARFNESDVCGLGFRVCRTAQ